MAGSIIVMLLIGFVAGYDLAYIMRVHFVIGCVIALFAGFCFWLPSKTSNIKKVRKIYEQSIMDFFQTQEDQDLFIKQMETGNYDKVNFYNVNEDTYPSRFIIGPDYWMNFSRNFCLFIRTSDIQSITEQQETTRVSYNTGGHRKGKNINIGTSLVVRYKENSVSAERRKNNDQSLFFSKKEQYYKVLELIKKQCPQYQIWIEDK